jgi:hypothetical protein
LAKKYCFPGLNPKPLARVNPKSRWVSDIIPDIITVVLKLLKNQITAFNIYGLGFRVLYLFFHENCWFF